MVRVALTVLLCVSLALAVGCGKRRVTTNIHTDMGTGETDMDAVDANATDMNTVEDASVVPDAGADLGITRDAGVTLLAEMIRCDTLPASEVAISLASGFSPNSTSIAAGQVVVFTNSDPFAHTITSTNGETVVPAPDGRFDFNVASGGTVCIRFNRVGSYPYFCSIHTSMRGTVTVGASEVAGP